MSDLPDELIEVRARLVVAMDILAYVTNGDGTYGPALPKEARRMIDDAAASLYYARRELLKEEQS